MNVTQAGYKYLKSYQLSLIIYDLTIKFCDQWVGLYSRTHDQMVQAARSGKQNIVEGYLEKSLKMYIKLLGVSRASLGELLEDYQDFARQHEIKLWSLDKARGIREIKAIRDRYTPDNPYVPELPRSQEEAINLLVTITNQCCYLLDKQGRSLEEKFIKEGGYSEKLFRKRLTQRK